MLAVACMRLSVSVALTSGRPKVFHKIQTPNQTTEGDLCKVAFLIGFGVSGHWLILLRTRTDDWT